MGNKDSKEKTPEQEAKEREEARAVNVKTTLESKVIQTSIGTNLVKLNPFDYGKFGLGGAEEAYNKLMNGEDVIKKRQELYNAKLKEGKALGVFGEPTITNYDVSVDYSKQLEEVMSIAKLDELMKYSKEAGAELGDLEIPKELKNYSKMEILTKYVNKENGSIDLSNLSKDEQKAFALYEKLSESYKRACAKKASEGNYFADLKEDIKQIVDSYKKMQKPKS